MFSRVTSLTLNGRSVTLLRSAGRPARARRADRPLHPRPTAPGSALTALRAPAAAAGIPVPATSPPSRSPRPPRCRTTARDALAAELRLLAIPSVWLATLGTVAGRPDELVLAAVVDAELLAVHAAVHDALAGRVRGPVAAYLPGTWLPHCVLATARPADAFAACTP